MLGQYTTKTSVTSFMRIAYEAEYIQSYRPLLDKCNGLIFFSVSFLITYKMVLISLCQLNVK